MTVLCDVDLLRHHASNLLETMKELGVTNNPRDAGAAPTKRPYVRHTTNQPVLVEARLVVSVKVTDGSYDSSLTLPLNASNEQFENAAKMWLQMMRDALALTSIEESRP